MQKINNFKFYAVINSTKFQAWILLKNKKTYAFLPRPEAKP